VIDARGRRPPVLATARLLLRELRTSDAPAVAAHAGDERVARYLIEVPSPYPVALARRWIHGRSAWWELGRGVTFAVVRRDAPDALLGTVSLRRHARDRRAELGYWLAASAWGRGLATEAVAQVLDFGFRQLALARIHAQVFAGNDASRRVLEKLGMVHEGTQRRHLRKGDRLHDVELYGLLREDWSPP
jgi:[ribosomal protein S5]-alanine N-acetyltransferase